MEGVWSIRWHQIYHVHGRFLIPNDWWIECLWPLTRCQGQLVNHEESWPPKSTSCAGACFIFHCNSPDKQVGAFCTELYKKTWEETNRQHHSLIWSFILYIIFPQLIADRYIQIICDHNSWCSNSADRIMWRGSRQKSYHSSSARWKPSKNVFKYQHDFSPTTHNHFFLWCVVGFIKQFHQVKKKHLWAIRWLKDAWNHLNPGWPPEVASCSWADPHPLQSAMG